MSIGKDVVVEIVIEYLKKKGDLTDLESDIISTITKYNEHPFDRKGAEQKVTENNAKYQDIFVAITAMPGIIVIPFSQVSDEDVRHNLKLQIEAMCFKVYTDISGKQ